MFTLFFRDQINISFNPDTKKGVAEVFLLKKKINENIFYKIMDFFGIDETCFFIHQKIDLSKCGVKSDSIYDKVLKLIRA